MNKKLLIPLAISFMVFAAASSAVFSNGKTEKTSAYTSSSLPTTIYLKDPEESTIRNYYSDLLSLEDNTEKQEATGDNRYILQLDLRNKQGPYHISHPNLKLDSSCII